jgi:Ca-activated chloride channel family protein
MAVARFRQGRFADAAALFGEAAAMARDPATSDDAYFNRGNAALQDGLTRLPPDGAAPTSAADLDAAAERFDQAKSDFRRVLAADPADEDARHNAELAHRKRQYVEELRKALPQQEQQQQNQQQQQDQQDQQQQPDDQQKPEPGQPQSGAPQENDQPSDANPQGSDARQGEGSPPSAPKPAPTGEGEPSDTPPDRAESPPKDDAASGDQSSTSPPDGDPEEGQSKQEQGGEGQSTPRRMSRDEAERLLQGVRDKERQRRQLQASREKTSRTPVDKDW